MIFRNFATMIKKQGTILIVDDNRNILTTVRMLLEPIFDGIITIANPNSIPAKLREEHPDVVLLDMNFSSGINSGNEGLYWLREIKSLSPKTEVVLFTAYADIQLAVTGIKEGAADFIVKPFENEKMIRTLVEARDKNMAVDNVINRKGGKTGGKDTQSAMYWGDSEVMNNLRSIVEKVAATDANILITGENGTGKEVLANEIHRLSTMFLKLFITSLSPQYIALCEVFPQFLVDNLSTALFLSLASTRVRIIFSLSKGLTMKSVAPSLMPVTAS